ncbi:glycosyltransferase family 2 protein [Aquihabitans sp. G128]|uniref:glycosyltransferase family 2 protein n=1 Tax=Aquihabitans sp. G128 TaxID=2849779 RepID=UPI001C2510DD|nr:glycosyltransferase family 2 protein [Aquihabitans sp. G128]QXC62829.1 glycosyltransferase family 2 protein [Aquihabitans sp. G128]
MAVTDHDPSGCDVSVLMPAYNEAENLVEVVPRTAAALEALGKTWEIVIVDDGSTDGTRSVMSGLRSDQVRYIRLRRNAGKSAALSVGLDHVRGEAVVLMDADGQDDPEELGKMLGELDNGVDCVTGRRAVRNDRFIKRNTSKIYNGVTTRVTGVKGKDFNSGFKAMSRELADSLEMYGELHRYIPILAVWSGFRISEVEVEHHERLHGRSKFGRARFWRGFLDLVTVKFLTTYTARPFHLFGGIGFVIGAVGSALLTWMLGSKLLGHSIGTRPALQLGVLLVVVAVQMVSLGLLGELMVNLRRRRSLDATAEGDL